MFDAWQLACGAVVVLLVAIAFWRSRERQPDEPRAASKLERVRQYRERYGVGLREALQAIEAQDAGAPLQPMAAPPPAADVEALVRQGRVIEAIKAYREQTGASLVEAKQVVDRLRKG